MAWAQAARASAGSTHVCPVVSTFRRSCEQRALHICVLACSRYRSGRTRKHHGGRTGSVYTRGHAPLQSAWSRLNAQRVVLLFGELNNSDARYELLAVDSASLEAKKRGAARSDTISPRSDNPIIRRRSLGRRKRCTSGISGGRGNRQCRISRLGLCRRHRRRCRNRPYCDALDRQPPQLLQRATLYLSHHTRCRAAWHRCFENNAPPSSP